MRIDPRDIEPLASALESAGYEPFSAGGERHGSWEWPFYKESQGLTRFVIFAATPVGRTEDLEAEVWIGAQTEEGFTRRLVDSFKTAAHALPATAERLKQVALWAAVRADALHDSDLTESCWQSPESQQVSTLERLYVEKLEEQYDTEHQVLDLLPAMRQAASSSHLKAAFAEKAVESQKQIDRLERVFESLGVAPARRRSSELARLLSTADEVREGPADPSALDEGLLAIVQSIDRELVAGYDAAHTYADLLGRHQEARLLEQVLREQKQMAERLAPPEQQARGDQEAEST